MFISRKELKVKVTAEGKADDQLTNYIKGANSLKGRPCETLRPRRQDLPVHQKLSGTFLLCSNEASQKSKNSTGIFMLPDHSLNFISKELGCNIYSLKTSIEEKSIVLRPTSLMTAASVSQGFLLLEKKSSHSCDKSR